MKRTATHRAADFFQRRRLGQFFAQHADDFFHALGGKPLLPLAEQFLFARRDEETIPPPLPAPWPDTRRFAPAASTGASRRLASNCCCRLVSRVGGATADFSDWPADDFAHERMQRRRKIAQMPPQKIKRHFNGEKLVPLLRLRASRVNGLFAAPVKSGRQRRERRFGFVEADAALAFEIQADLDAAGMKTFAPVKFRRAS